MKTRFAGASIWSEDLNRSLLPFYRDIIGLKVAMESERYVMFEADEPDVPALSLGSHSEVHGNNNDPARHMIGLNTDDVRAEFERLKGLGVEFIEEPTQYDGITIATLKDPEGNYVQLFETTSNA